MIELSLSIAMAPPEAIMSHASILTAKLKIFFFFFLLKLNFTSHSGPDAKERIRFFSLPVQKLFQERSFFF